MLGANQRRPAPNTVRRTQLARAARSSGLSTAALAGSPYPAAMTRGSMWVSQLALAVGLLALAVALPVRLTRATGQTWDRFTNGQTPEQAETATAPFDPHGFLAIGAWMFSLPTLGLAIVAVLALAFRQRPGQVLLLAASLCWVPALVLTRVFYAPWWLAAGAVLVTLASVVLPVRAMWSNRRQVNPDGAA